MGEMIVRTIHMGLLFDRTACFVDVVIVHPG